MDIVFIRELKVDTLVGIYDWERRLRQHVILDIEMGADIARAAKSDKIEDTQLEHLELAVAAFDRLARKTLGWIKRV